MKQRKAHKGIALIAVILMLIPALISCEARALAPSKDALSSVGQVNGREIAYEELYFLAENYKSVGEESGEGAGYTAEELRELVWENLIQNSVRLEVCEDAGLIYDEEELSDEVEAMIKAQIASEHDGKRGNYLSWLSENGLTDHYYRYLLGVDLLFGRLPAKYAEDGLIPKDDAGMLAYVKENFVNTVHVAIFFDESNKDEKRAKAEEALQKLNDGELSMNQLIGRYSEEFGLATEDSYYLAKSNIEPEYRDAVLSIGIGTCSGIVESHGQNSMGLYSDCFYIIKRLPMSDADLIPKLDDLRADACDAIAYEKSLFYTETLRFVPNEFALSLDLTDLEAPGKGSDPVLVWGLTVGAVAVLAIGGTVVGVVLWKRKKAAAFAAVKPVGKAK